ncbi:hypothetical protein NITHO_3310007 [Nitrolancea hollandica Lb]|uniref:Uncharacterized protein n=1 Tax=Nitrolancea hollandica Lb TaxID=1129897 RepID=I4EHX8_9BACT|nr:hypothetical protein NITHO_3310007 [Nitrolancea hollandica Lb]
MRMVCLLPCQIALSEDHVNPASMHPPDQYLVPVEPRDPAALPSELAGMPIRVMVEMARVR